MTTDVHANPRRLQHRLDALARFGALPHGGVCRLAFSPEDKQARDYVETRMRALGLSVRIDRIGNILGVRAGQVDGPLVIAGSHVDTVATGGRFDGSTGVMAALEVVETLNEARVETRHPLAVVAFANEEGARFTPDMMGSLVVRGDLSVDRARTSVDIAGTSVGEAIDAVGYAGPDDLTGLDVKAYLELHIEQGPLLEDAGCTIGVVEAVQGIKWLAFTLGGAAAHAGATPIALRRDAAYVAGAIVQFVRQIALGIDNQRATVGSLTLAPNIVNVVAESARLVVDLRNPDANKLEAAEATLRAFIADTAGAERVTVECQTLADVPPVGFDLEVVGAVERSSAGLGYRSMRMVSGAGHDAQIMARRYPAGMIFVPSRGGVSHNVNEFTTTEDLEAGANVLLHTLLALAA